MAHRCSRLFLQYTPGCMKINLLDPSKSQSAFGIGAVAVANLTSYQSHGNEIKRAKPWPYRKKQYTLSMQFIDHTTKRFNDNTKVIVVDGNVATGKSDFAEKLAEEFDMALFSDTKDEHVFKTASGFDIRELDEQLPPGARNCDIPTFFLQNAHPDTLKTIGRTQLMIYKERFYNYVYALEHLLNTGQGVVVERGPWSDCVFAEALKRHGHISSKGLKFYYDWRNNSVCELWKPHVYIYLDAPVSKVRQLINERDDLAETKGKVQTDEYLQTIEDVYKKTLLPLYKQHCEVLTYDVDDMPDWEIIVEDLENLNLETNPKEYQSPMFEDWRHELEDDWNYYRMWLGYKWRIENLFGLPIPWEAPEMALTGDDFQEYVKIVLKHPEVKYLPGYNPERDNIMFRL